MAVKAIPTKAGAYLSAEVLAEVAADWKLAPVKNGKQASTVVLTVPEDIRADEDKVASFKSNASYRVKNAAKAVAGTREGFKVASSATLAADKTSIEVATFWREVQA